MAAHPHVNSANRYCSGVLSGKIPAGVHVIQACQRQTDNLKDSKEGAYRFDLDRAEDICDFAEQMKHTKGKWAGSNLVLEPWQCFILTTVFGWLRKSDGLRRFREIYAEIPRKNGKSILGAIIGNYMLVADNEPAAEIFSGATTQAQALEVFRPAWLQVKKNPEFAKFYGLSLSGTHQNPGPIYCLSTGSRFEPVIGNPGDGSSPHCSIVDEYHEHRTSMLYDAMATGMGARAQPMQAVLTTAGTNTSAPCYDKRCQCTQILDGTIQNDNIFTIIYSLDAADDWADIKLWRKANPNFGVSVFPDYLKKQHLDALQSSAKQNIIKCKHLNEWCDAGVSFYNMVEWEKCAVMDVSENDFIGEPCWIGVDLASKIDVTAVVKIFRQDDDYYVFPRLYVPEARTQGEDAAIYAGWAHDGYLLTTPGNMVDQKIITEDIKEDARNFDVKALCVDPWNASQFVVDMVKLFGDHETTPPEDRKIIEVQQTVKNLSEPMKFSDALIRSGKLHHDGNPVMTWMMGNVTASMDRNDNVFPRKERAESKIDGPVALITGLSRAMLVAPEQKQPLPVFF